ncbi:nitrous oxide reductase family maturation protein NosD [Streptomyces sp. NPDC088354]|uniref:right-handed parallel beta-helix repeat-containing protein n=1 Tax=unclassified Streptomyces TaxID=2593676 RepID=UPI0029BC56D2|nr:right-handed parallel beta-helix repeat-containing protein [Streptomyces sp. MI02-7b]MDX3073131.1 right-handed parallel beta-helix repeat-containing protein [Streptomyces sp. MI02-7b]
MTLRRAPAAAAAVATAAVVVGLCGAPGVEAADAPLLVRPGESIQAAVDRAKPGDIIEIAPGTYPGSVSITKPRLTLLGAGRETVITPSEKGTENACAAAGHGVCVTGTEQSPLTYVRLRSLTVSGFRKNGVDATWTDRMEVNRVTARANGQQGISQQRSVRAVFRDNVAENNGESGIFLANAVDAEGGALDTKHTLIADNELSGNRIGLVLRRVRTVDVEYNDITANCGGVFVVGDEGVPRAGSLTVSRNLVAANNKFCPANARLPFIQGAGIVLTGAEKTQVTDNRVVENIGTSPMSGGIVLFRSVVGAPNTGNSVRDNTAMGNSPADLSADDQSKDNVFSGSTCRVSQPKGLC